MDYFSKQVFSDVEDMLQKCDQILESSISEEELPAIRQEMEELRRQSIEYYDNLKDQVENSKLEFSRKVASMILREDKDIKQYLEDQYLRNRAFFTEPAANDIDERALYVEYLSGRARQAFRDAMMGAINLRLLAGINNKNGREGAC